MKVKTLLIGALSIVMLAIIVGCTVPEVTVQPDGTSVTNQVVDPKLTAGLELAKTVNTATGAAGVNPYYAVIGWILTVISGGAAWVAKLKNDKANKLLKVVVQGVEQSKSTDAKSAIEAHSANAGVKLELDSAVQKIVSGNA